MSFIKWWHTKILKHKPMFYEFLKASTVVTCECNAQWVDYVTKKEDNGRA